MVQNDWHSHMEHRGAHMGPRLLVAIVNRPDGPKAQSLLRKSRHPFVLTLLAKGTAGAGIADLMGFGEMDKALVLSMMPELRAREALASLREGLRLDKSHRGIAFCVPVDGICLPGKTPLSQEHKAHIQARIEEGVNEVMDSIRHELVLAVVPEGASEALVERAREAGAPGATVFSARQSGTEAAELLLGLRFDPEREVVALLVAREQKQPLMDAISAHLKKAQTRGLVFSLPVDAVAGLSEQA